MSKMAIFVQKCRKGQFLVKSFGKSDFWSKMSKIQTDNITRTNVLIWLKNLFSLKIKKKSISRQKSRKVNSYQNVDKCRNSRFLVKNVVKCQRSRFFVKNIEKVDFWPKISIFVEKVDFWSKISKKLIFGRKFRFLSKKSIFGQKYRKS